MRKVLNGCLEFYTWVNLKKQVVEEKLLKRGC